MKFKKFLLTIPVGILTLPIISISCSKEIKSKNSVDVIDTSSIERKVRINAKNIAIPGRSGIGMLIAFGLGDRISGVYKSTLDNQWINKIYPNSKKYTKLQYSPNKEEYLAQGYDLVIAPDPIVANSVIEAGMSSMVISQYHQPTYDDFITLYPEILTKIFTDTQVKNKVNTWINELNQIILEIKEKLSNKEIIKKVWYVRGDKNKGVTYTESGQDTLLSSIMRILKVYYVPGEFTIENNVATKEQLLKDNADYYLFGGKFQNENINALKSDETFSSLKAVRQNNLINIPLGVIPFEQIGVELKIFIAYLANEFWPEIFNFDIRSMLKNTYKTYYNYDLADDEITKILSGIQPNA
ncbi:ABC transporter substrate-binding protein [Mycoplasma sp. CSL10166]|uniref:ABC transporter substrate-binding protein n=1 Tax=Mycoplasma sp. CSL10166 TaxID=2813825 RepID=UPI00197B499D|nr:ABC transporter substrate-binding protein [Mycoplasma sp. CSL10166]MBN4084215.1 ABC transporter substrate-binding protein [Mycoplasma sp. CSL10166]